MIVYFLSVEQPCDRLQLEEEIQEDLKWSILVKEKLFSGKSDFQSIELVESGPFGKAIALSYYLLLAPITLDIPNMGHYV